LPKDQTVKEIAGAIDLLPTLLSLAGIERVGDAPLDGRDLSPLLLNTNGIWPDRTIFSSWNRNVSARTQQYRLDNRGELYDMIADPGQTKPVTKEHPEVAEKLLAEVKAWRKEVGIAQEQNSQPKAAKKSVDPRPIPVGYKALPRTWLPARDGEPLGNVKRSSSAPNSSYFVNWTSKDDSLEWEIEVLSTGQYEVEILYTCPLDSAGATIELSHQESKLTGKVNPGWDPPLYTNQDTIARPPAESKMKPFKSLKLGTIQLQRGRGPLTLRATDIPGQEVMQVLEVNLTLISP
jgi:hypothetical protein